MLGARGPCVSHHLTGYAGLVQLAYWEYCSKENKKPRLRIGTPSLLWHSVAKVSYKATSDSKDELTSSFEGEER